ncbi:MAG: FGGY-family carbohydrate kinase [Pseudothermotoga sp.]
MYSELFAAIDIGTTNVKVAVFDRNGDKVFDFQRRCTESTANNTHEIDPEKWWKIVVQGFHTMDENLRKRIVSICTTGQGPTTVLVDKDGRTVRKAITWLDKRGYEYINSIIEKGIDEQIATVISHLLSIQKDIDQAYLIQPSDYIVLKLTGSIVNATFPFEGYLPWNQKVLELYDLNKTFLIPELIPAGSIIGRISKEVSKTLGLNDQVKIIAGSVDFAMALVGTGVLEDGMLCDRGGTSQGLTLCSRERFCCQGLITVPFFIKDYWKVSAVMTTTGKSYEWLSRNVTRTRLVELSQLIAVKRPTNVIFLPHLNGERSPYWNKDLKGVFFGLTLKDDWRSLLVSVIEGVAYAMKNIVQIMESCGYKIKTIRATGGQAMNELWNQIKADVLGREIEVPEVFDSELLGCAIISNSTLTGEGFTDLSKKVVKISKVFTPMMARHREYERCFQVYKELHERNIDLFSKL